MFPHLFKLKNLSTKAGAAPGTLVHIGEQKVDRVNIDVVRFSSQALLEQQVDSLSDALALQDSTQSLWLNINGLHDTQLISRIGDHFHIHALTLEDILNTVQRPKVETFDRYIYIVLNMLQYDADTNKVASEQLSLILTENALISFQESKGDVFDSVRERLRSGSGRIRKAGCDYLAYALIDAVVDHYFSILEQAGSLIDEIEEDILDVDHSAALQDLHDLRREILHLRKQIWPLREVINLLSRETTKLIQTDTTLFLRDVYDHTIQVIETIESYRDLLAGLTDLYISIGSNRMNEVMKVLTIISTIFIPISFIAGVYGMNFKRMPELDWAWGYPMVWAVMVVVVVMLLFYFKHKRWL